MTRTGEVSWRAWLGMGDAERMSQIDVAEFRTAADARAWVERRLAAARSRPGMMVFGSIDRGTYRPARLGAPPSWHLERDPEAMDANIVDGRVAWHRPGRCCEAFA
jgi:hypothetical protein